MEINGYDEEYVGWGPEDQDFALRLTRNGIKGIKTFRICLAYHLYHPEADTSHVLQNCDYFNKQNSLHTCCCLKGISAHIF